MAVLTVLNQRAGTGPTIADGNKGGYKFNKRIDIARAVAEAMAQTPALTNSDYINVYICALPAGSRITSFDAVISATIAVGSSNSISIGTTAAAPIELVNAQTNTAVGRFTAVAATTIAAAATDQVLYLQVRGASITTGTGAVSIDVTIHAPASQALPLAAYKTQVNV